MANAAQEREIKRTSLKIALSWGVVAALALIFVAPPANARRHVVVKGETLGTIAKRYNCPITRVRRANRIKGDLIKVGQRLKLPSSCVPAPAKSREGDKEIITHRVRPGETLGKIAQDYGVTVTHIRNLNRKVRSKGAVIRVGQKLKLRPKKSVKRRRIYKYKIRPGDTLTRIAKKHGLKLADIKALNPRKDPNKLRIGDRIYLYREGPENPSSAVGKPQNGRLVNGEQMPPGPGYYRRRPHRSWGTNETISALTDVINTVRRKHPHVHDVALGDISAKAGGKLPPHRSHQTGRDVDIGFYFKDAPSKGPRAFWRAHNHKLDYPALWTFLTELAGTSPTRSKVDYMFIGYTVQRDLYQWAKARKKSDKLLSYLFQYPRGRRAMRGVIRHEPGHTNHIHIRFKCAQRDTACL